jgi:hypothetical protein
MKTPPIPNRGLVAAAIVALVAAASASARAPAAEHAATACTGAVSHAVIPAWARGGFSEPRPRVPHVLGRSGAIVAILFGNPLASPPASDHNNKILWVAHRAVAFGDMRIRAQRMQGRTPIGTPVARSVAGGPGPSIIDLPAAGCWRLTLSWKHGIDTLDLHYAKPAHA